MIALKKLYGDELLRLALVLSLLKADPNEFLETETQQLIAGLHRSNGTDWSIEQEARTLIRPTHIHPKSLDHILANHERQIFDELNSLGRYNSLDSNGRISSYIHTYLVNNVATETVAPVLSEEHGLEEAAASTMDDGVSADDNVGQEVKVSNEDASEDEDAPDLIVTVTQEYLNNRTEADLLADIVTTRTFDVNDFINAPDEVQIKKEPQESIIDVEIKEKRDDSLFDDNAFDDYVSYFSDRMKYEIGEPNSVLRQNIADLEDYSGIVDDEKNPLKDNSADSERNAEDLEKYLLKNTPLDFEELNLGSLFNDVKIEVKRERASTSFTSASSSGVSEMESVMDDSKPDVKLEPDEGHHSGDELTQEDMDLIDVLWKQDVDMGFSVDNPSLPVAPDDSKLCLDDVEVELKRAEEKIQAEEREKDIEKVKASLLDDLDKDDDPWAGLSYVVDTETGEYILQGDLPSELINSEDTRFDLLEEAASIVVIGDEEKNESEALGRGEGAEGAEGAMLHPAMARGVPHHHHHPLAHYHNQSLMRSMSSEQRWQDLASLLTIPPPPEQYHYHQSHHNHGVHGAATSYAPSYGPIVPPLPDKHPEPYASGPPLEGAYKVEAPPAQHHDGLYYQSPPAPELGATNNDGFLQSILNDEDLQLMDMAVNEGMYTMRILDGGSTVHHAAAAPHHTHSHMMMTAERDSASDSAVSSMGSERVPSLSDGEWCDSAGSDTAHDYHSSKFRPYEASYGRDRGAPQKKHHMFGKRCFQEPAVKYEPCGEATTHYAPDHTLHNMHADFARQQSVPAPHILPHSLDLNTAHSSHALLQSPSARYPPAAVERIRHNHTYTQPEPARDRRVRRVTEESTASAGHLTRDEKRAKALGIPIEVHEIINLPMDEFNERLSKHDLSEAQLSLIRDIRRRGKNKVAAQNCRKRKLDQITSLADEVRSVRDRKLRTQRDHAQLLADRQRAKERFAKLYRHVFQNLRDAEGRPLSSAQYSLQQAADGNVVLVPRMTQPTGQYTHDPSMNRASDDEIERKTKTFDQ